MHRIPLRIVTASIAVFLSVSLCFAQEDPDPNSPTPVFLSIEGSGRALAYPALKSRKYSVARPSREVFAPDMRIVLFVTNLELMKGEGPDAFRIIAEDAKGRTYRFPVLDLQPATDQPGVYALTTRLRDTIGYWPQPEPTGDLKLFVTWRGLSSNSLLLGYGSTGGKFTTDKSIKPSPLSEYLARSTSFSKEPNYKEPNYVGYRWSGDRMRFLEQATFGPTATLDARLRRIGLRTWLAEQFELPYPTANNPYPNQPLKPGNAPADCDNEQTITPDVPVTCFRDTYTQYQPQTWFLREAFYGDAQLRHRIAWALSQIWVTSGVDIQQGRHMVEYHKVLSANAFGNYRTLMKEMTLNPTMGDYLDMARSTRTNPNENYPREIMQLFTIGLFMLNQNGTFQRDAQNNLIPTYDQNVVNNLTKVMTGWSFCNQATCPNVAVGTVNFIDPMVLNGGVTTVSNNRHDLTAKTLLSYPGSTTTNVAACANCTTLPNIATYANSSLDQALDNIFYHPNLGPYIGKNLIQQLVTSDPTPEYVSRVAAAFNDNGFGVRGDMKAVIRAILLDPEARGDAKTDPFFGKLREPVLFTTNFSRAFGIRGANGAGTTSDGYFTGRGEFTGMGQDPFRSPTVFNYYPPDYVIPGTSMLGPEFAIMTTGTSITRTNFINRMVFTTIPIPISNPNSPNGTAFDFSDLQALVVADPTNNRLLDELDRRMLHGTMSPTMKSTIMTAVNSITVSNPPTDSQTLSRVRQAIYLVATSSQYQVQR